MRQVRVRGDGVGNADTISETVINVARVGGSTSYVVPPTFIFVGVCNTAAATFCSCVLVICVFYQLLGREVESNHLHS